MFEKVTLKHVQLPVVTKQHDDKFLTSACEAIGERPCVNGERCLARFIAQVRYGVDTKMAFTCKEFLLPQQYEEFKAGGGLPLRRGKCLLCTRYFTVRYTLSCLERLCRTPLIQELTLCACYHRITCTSWYALSNSRKGMHRLCPLLHTPFLYHAPLLLRWWSGCKSGSLVLTLHCCFSFGRPAVLLDTTVQHGAAAGTLDEWDLHTLL